MEKCKKEEKGKKITRHQVIAQTKCQNLSMSRLGKFGKIYKEKKGKNLQDIKLAQTKCQNLSMSKTDHL